MQVSVIFDSRICSTVMRHIIVLSACSNTLGPSASRAGYDWACIFSSFLSFFSGEGIARLLWVLHGFHFCTKLYLPFLVKKGCRMCQKSPLLCK